MKDSLDYININKNSWNNRTDIHYDSDFYDNKSFIAGQSSLNPIELALLPDLKGKSVLHLQCHFGQDTISLNRLGADAVGVDLSDKAIKKAKELALTTNSTAEFICCDVYDLPKYLDRKFDFVFTSYGTIGWLPDLDKWAALIARYLKPNGQLVFVEFHPIVWMFDDDFQTVKYSYFNTGPIVENESGTYTDRDAPITQEYVMWNHGISEVVNSLIKKGLSIQDLQEYDYSPYNCFQHTIEFAPKQYRIKHMNDHLPMVYSVVAKK
ncbi:MAG: class I SAM-dependent methyltransferase [Aureispira sp.]|nr:class I SAM-dependent methyltransferase [Aureispira sp.]